MDINAYRASSSAHGDAAMTHEPEKYYPTGSHPVWAPMIPPGGPDTPPKQPRHAELPNESHDSTDAEQYSYNPSLLPQNLAYGFNTAYSAPAASRMFHPYARSTSPPAPMQSMLSSPGSPPTPLATSLPNTTNYSNPPPYNHQMLPPMMNLSMSSQFTDVTPTWTYSPTLYGSAGSHTNKLPYVSPSQQPHKLPFSNQFTTINGLAYPPAQAKSEPYAAEEDMDEEDEERNTGLGLTSTKDDDAPPVPGRKEDVRKARIESEQKKKRLTELWQRRRNEMREGFNRLRETLPATNHRSSKTAVLDRAIAHIQTIEAANRYLMGRLEIAARENEALRASNAKLVDAHVGGLGHPGESGMHATSNDIPN